MQKRFLPYLMLLPFFLMGVHAPASAQNSTQNADSDARLVVQGSGLHVPRFVTLKSDEINMRVGPGREYPLAWIYKRKGLPVKVIAEFDVWRKVEDHEGITGWVHGQLVSARRTALVNEPVSKLYQRPETDSNIVAVAEKGVLMELQYCRDNWCRLSNEQVRGWIPRSAIWGALDGETID